MHYPGGNSTDPIWRVLASSDGGISSWTPLKPQHSDPPKPNSRANQLWYIDFLTPPTALIIPHKLPAFLESLMPLKNWCSIYARWSKSSLKHSIRFSAIFPSLKQSFIAYHFSKVSDCIFEIHQLWQSGFSRLYSNYCCSSSFEAEIIKIDQSSHKKYSNNIVNFWRVYNNFKCLYKKGLETYWSHHVVSTDVLIWLVKFVFCGFLVFSFKCADFIFELKLFYSFHYFQFNLVVGLFVYKNKSQRILIRWGLLAGQKVCPSETRSFLHL